MLHATEHGKTPGSRRDQLEVDHVFADHLARRGSRKAPLVRAAPENRHLSQDPEFRLLLRAVEAAHGRAPRQPAGNVLHFRLADLLVDDAQPSTRHAKLTLAFTPIEVELLTHLKPERKQTLTQRSLTLQACLTQLARLGRYLNRAGAGPPGNTVIWRGLSRLTDSELGYLLGVQHVGN